MVQPTRIRNLFNRLDRFARFLHLGRLSSICPLLALFLTGCNQNAKAPSAPFLTASLAPEGIFRNVAQEAGLGFRWGHGGKSPLTILETLGHGCAFLDYDQDGLLDILLVGNPRCALYHNVGNGRFTDVTSEAGITAEGLFLGVAVGDVDNDAYPDLYLYGYGKCVLYHNRGIQERRKPNDEGPTTNALPVLSIPPNTQTPNTKHPHTEHQTPYFEDATAKAGVGARGPYDMVTAAAFADLDGDGRLDLFAGRYLVFTPTSVQFCTYSGVKSSCGVRNYEADFPRVYRNLGKGAFADTTTAWGFGKTHGKCLGIAIRGADTGNGVMLYVANDEEPGELFMPKGRSYEDNGPSSGTAFTNGLPQAGMGVDWGDYDNDGRSDLVVATFQGEMNSLYHNDGENLYSETSGPLGITPGTMPYVAWTARFFDYDNDGWLDLFFTNGHVQDNVSLISKDRSYPQPLQLYHNEQGRSFREDTRAGTPFQTPVVGRGAAFGDYDNDGRVDALVVDAEGSPLLLHNESKTGHHWLGIRLAGRRNNRDGIGARVTVMAGGRQFVQDQKISGGYLSSHDSRLHFGLGQATRVARIVVRWPDGRTDTVREVSVDRYITLTESRGTTR